MKLEMEIDIDKFKYGLVGNGYLYKEVIVMSDEKALAILKNRIIQDVQNNYIRSQPIIRDVLSGVYKDLQENYNSTATKTQEQGPISLEKFTDQAVNRTRPQSLPDGNVILFQNHREGQ
jgi:hypothetical protein